MTTPPPAAVLARSDRQPPPGPSTALGRGHKKAMARRADASGLIFLIPALLCFGYFAWYPMVRGVVLAFQQSNLVDPAMWVGLDNFRAVFNDPTTVTAVKNTLEYAGLAMVIGFPVPLLFAVQMATLRRGGGLFRFLVYLPVILPPVVAVLLWKVFYDPDNGLFNAIFGLVGLGPFPWLQSTSSAMVSVVLEATWASFGGAALIYLAALTRVPPELYEAAEVAGAGIWRRLWHVALPNLRNTILLLLLLQIVGTLQVFTEPAVMTDGGPLNSTVTLMLLVYRMGFVNGNYGEATALSVLLAAALAILSAIYLRATRAWSHS